jgi:hypothetical protein
VEASLDANAAPVSDEAWSFRYVSSYFVSISFMLGAMLLVFGCAFDVYEEYLNGLQKRGTVERPFFVGCIMFAVGSYFGLLMVMNAGHEDGNFDESQSTYSSIQDNAVAREGVEIETTMYNKDGTVKRGASSSPSRRRIWWRWVPEGDMPVDSFWGYWTYLVGSVLFTEAMAVAALPSVQPMWRHVFLVDLPQTVGGVLFVAGSHISLRHNHWMRCNDVAWHASFLSLIGSYMFLLGGASGMYRTLNGGDALHQTNALLGTKLPFLIGSAQFLVSSTLELWLWKQERFGLALAHPLDYFSPIDEHSSSSSSSSESEGGGGGDGIVPHAVPFKQRKTVTLVDVLWIVVSVFGCCVATIDLSFVCLSAEAFNRKVLDSATIVVLFSGVLVLGSVVHRVPPEPPYPQMLIGLRFLMLVFAVDKSWEMASWFWWAGKQYKKHAAA